MRISDWSSDVCSSDLKECMAVKHFPVFPYFPPSQLNTLKRSTKTLSYRPGSAPHHALCGEISSASTFQPILDVTCERVRILAGGAARLAATHFAAVGARQRFIPTEQRSEEHTSELQSLMRISYAVFCLKNKNSNKKSHNT